MAGDHAPADVASLYATLFARGARGPCLLLEALTRLSWPSGIFSAFVF
jgi:hypothetical protein